MKIQLLLLSTILVSSSVYANFLGEDIRLLASKQSNGKASGKDSSKGGKNGEMPVKKDDKPQNGGVMKIKPHEPRPEMPCHVCLLLNQTFCYDNTNGTFPDAPPMMGPPPKKGTTSSEDIPLSPFVCCIDDECEQFTNSTWVCGNGAHDINSFCPVNSEMCGSETVVAEAGDNFTLPDFNRGEFCAWEIETECGKPHFQMTNKTKSVVVFVEGPDQAPPEDEEYESQEGEGETEVDDETEEGEEPEGDDGVESNSSSGNSNKGKKGGKGGKGGKPPKGGKGGNDKPPKGGNKTEECIARTVYVVAFDAPPMKEQGNQEGPGGKQGPGGKGKQGPMKGRGLSALLEINEASLTDIFYDTMEKMQTVVQNLRPF